MYYDQTHQLADQQHRLVTDSISLYCLVTEALVLAAGVSHQWLTVDHTQQRGG